ncbi:MAG TPA: ribbon-helix-helix domain-containing protein [Burkholderiales bacterium]|nr:ribbon-helix-helix domain-containing protein [Burkholderiales bacterium]
MKTVTIKLPSTLDAKLAAIAERRGARSKSEVIREALDRFVATEQAMEPGSLLEALEDFAGVLEGPTDLSTHPKYLEDFGSDSSRHRRRRSARRVSR